jgi:hypothetical protein
MTSNRLRPKVIVLAGGIVAVAMIGLTAGCGNGGQQAPTTTTTTTTTTTSPPSTPAPPPPTEKDINPTGGNLFTPGVKAPPAQSVSPGQHPGINGVP